jgi:eukaryotic-like serine/threonine-protein kinase
MCLVIHEGLDEVKTCPVCKLTYPDDRAFCFVDGADLISMQDARIGSTLAGRYLIESVLGEGGMATVYAAKHLLVERTCAIKIMSPLLARDSVVRERFRREAKSAQRLAHPNIIEIFDQGETDDGTSYIVMERLDGSSLAEVIAQGAIPVGRAVGMMIQICRGIARAHDLDVIHRDLKPENIFICRRTGAVVKGEAGSDAGDLVKLLDFGIARSLGDSRLTGAGELFGTPQYMAPERISNTEPGMPADLYALGCIFYEMIAGKLPFESNDIATFFVKHLKEIPALLRASDPKVPQELDDLIQKLLAKDPKARPVDAHRVNQELTALAKKYRIDIPPEPQSDAVTSSRPQSTLRELEPSRWTRNSQVYAKMLARAFGATPPNQAKSLVDQITVIAKRIVELNEANLDAQRDLEAIAEKGREHRQRIGFAVDALGVDGSKAKQAERRAEEVLAPLKEKTEQARAKYQLSHKEIRSWEGRSAFMEPYAELSKAYRAAADAVDAWLVLRKEESNARASIAKATQAVQDLEFQIAELRSGLQLQERKTENKEDALSKKIEDQTKELAALEKEITEMSRSFADPLRNKPELKTLFQELD